MMDVGVPTGVLSYRLEPDGPWYEVENKVTVNYRPVMAKSMAGKPGITYIGFGSSATAATKDDTSITPITGLPRQAISYITAATDSFTVAYNMPSGVGNGVTMKEAGLFDSSTGGNMFARIVLSPAIVKTNAIAPFFKWKITLAAAK